MLKQIEQYKNRDKSNQYKELLTYNEFLKKKKEELISVIIKTTNSELEDSFIIQKSAKFSVLEMKFTDRHYEYKDRTNNFMIDNHNIEKEKTLEQNHIGNNAKIFLQ